MAIRASDQISIVDLTDAYSVMLTCDSYVIPASTTAPKASTTFSTRAVAYCGAAAVQTSVTDNIKYYYNLNTSTKAGTTTRPTGLTVTVNKDTSNKSVLITFTAGTDMTTAVLGTPASLDIEIPVSIDDTEIVIYKRMSVSLALSGSDGVNGATWYNGTGVTGENTTGQVFTGSGVSSAKLNDMYINPSTGLIYKCTLAGNASTAKWAYAGKLKGEDGKDGDDGADAFAITMNVTSSAGTVFKNSSVNTTLTAHVYINGEENETFSNWGTIKWYKDNVYMSGKDGKTLTITGDDVDNTTTFEARLEYTAS